MDTKLIKNFLISLIILFIILFCLATYAFIKKRFINKEDIKDDFSKYIKVTFNDTSNLSFINVSSEESFIKNFTVENISDKTIYYDIMLIDVINNYDNLNNLTFSLISSDGAYVKDSILPNENSLISSYIKINKNEKHDYQLNINYTGQYNESDSNKTFSSKIIINKSDDINIGNNLYDKNTLGEKIISQVLGSEKQIDFNDNNSNGIYYTNNSINGNTIYFYRGNVDNNVIIDKYCFKIIRTTSSNGIRLIYNGISDNGKCLEENNIIDNISFNKLYDSNAYVGYIYGVNSTNYNNEHENINQSNIKIYLDSWFNNNLRDLKIFDNDSYYCSNRSLSSFNYFGVSYSEEGYGKKNTGYLSMKNLVIDDNIKPTYKCNVNDRFSVSNNKLNYSIGLLTVDEAYYAGYNNNTSNNYLYSEVDYWTMTPAYFNGSKAYNFVVSKDKVIQSSVDEIKGVRPVISINKSVKIKSGDGTKEKPYLLY